MCTGRDLCAGERGQSAARGAGGAGADHFGFFLVKSYFFFWVSQLRWNPQYMLHRKRLAISDDVFLFFDRDSFKSSISNQSTSRSRAAHQHHPALAEIRETEAVSHVHTVVVKKTQRPAPTSMLPLLCCTSALLLKGAAATQSSSGFGRHRFSAHAALAVGLAAGGGALSVAVAQSPCCSWHPSCEACTSDLNWCTESRSNCKTCMKTDPKLRWCPSGANLSAPGQCMAKHERPSWGTPIDISPDVQDPHLIHPARAPPTLTIWLAWGSTNGEGASTVDALHAASQLVGEELTIQVVCILHDADPVEVVVRPKRVVADHEGVTLGFVAHFLTVPLTSTGNACPEDAARVLRAIEAWTTAEGSTLAHPPQTAVNLEWDKRTLQPFLRSHGLSGLVLKECDPHPLFSSVNSELILEPSAVAFPFPVIVKPIASAGSRGVVVVQDAGGLPAAVRQNGGPSNVVIQEPLLDPDVWAVYFTAWKGKLLRRTCRRCRFGTDLGKTHGGNAVDGMTTEWMPCSAAPVDLRMLETLVREAAHHGFSYVNLKRRGAGSTSTSVELTPGVFDFNARIGGGLLRSALKTWPIVRVDAGDIFGVPCPSGTGNCAPPPLISHIRAFLAMARRAAVDHRPIASTSPLSLHTLSV